MNIVANIFCSLVFGIAFGLDHQSFTEGMLVLMVIFLLMTIHDQLEVIKKK